MQLYLLFGLKCMVYLFHQFRWWCRSSIDIMLPNVSVMITKHVLRDRKKVMGESSNALSSPPFCLFVCLGMHDATLASAVYPPLHFQLRTATRLAVVPRSGLMRTRREKGERRVAARRRNRRAIGNITKDLHRKADRLTRSCFVNGETQRNRRTVFSRVLCGC